MLSVAIITLNEEENLPRCLESVRDLASEIIVIDSGSTDRTREIAEKFRARFEMNPWPGHVAQKNFALERCTQPWILCLDADEEVSPELAAAIRSVFAAGEPPERGFLINRLNFYLGQWIRHAWYPEWRLRLVKRGQARWAGLDPHDKLEFEGPSRRLRGDLHHYSFRSVRDHFEKTLKYARITAESYAREGHRFHWYQLIFSPWFAFLKVILWKSGWLDGWRGWIIAGAKGFNVFAKYAFLLERTWPSPSRDKRA
jgi:glycosyltransferase involved in cell wall biosynthesis